MKKNNLMFVKFLELGQGRAKVFLRWFGFRSTNCLKLYAGALLSKTRLYPWRDHDSMTPNYHFNKSKFTHAAGSVRCTCTVDITLDPWHSDRCWSPSVSWYASF